MTRTETGEDSETETTAASGETGTAAASGEAETTAASGETGTAAASGETETTAGERETTPADDAFAALSDETRLAAVSAVAAADEPPTFTDLFEASDADTSAGFAYHLRQLTDRYLRKDPETERYELTYAGRAVARALDAGTFTERVDRAPTGVDGDCPVCGASALAAAVVDNVVAVACRDCETDLLALPFPPGGVRERDTADVVEAFDAYHRRRVALAADGVCPDCAGVVDGAIDLVETPALPGEEPRPLVAAGCESCGFHLRVPVSLTVVEHPAVVALFDRHGESVRNRPVWNLGPEWHETVLSTEPPAVAVTVSLGEDRVRLLVGDGPTVVDVERDEGAERDERDEGAERDERDERAERDERDERAERDEGAEGSERVDGEVASERDGEKRSGDDGGEESSAPVGGGGASASDGADPSASDSERSSAPPDASQ
ncbi:ArsR family transcriptional regulator [Halobaculum sp. MBLA0147]|uniref:DUF7351 domain-containing protein n=1 Tax=Halobaculum sp. MBLA0147 TaxID=3079934 RepID=UPI0035237B24